MLYTGIISGELPSGNIVTITIEQMEATEQYRAEKEIKEFYTNQCYMPKVRSINFKVEPINRVE